MPSNPASPREGEIDMLVRLDECPPGLFWFGETLGFRSEYTTHNEIALLDQPDAYVVETGEYFWGGAKTSMERSALLVQPIAAWNRRALQPAPESEGEVQKLKMRGDNHWETLRSIRHIARESGDLQRIIQWVDDAGSGYTQSDAVTMAEQMDEIAKLKAELTALRAAGLALGAQGWRPIESAPKDGAIIWGWMHEPDTPGYQMPCYWNDGAERWLIFQNDAWCSDYAPTHWRPLPPPPAGEEG